MEYRPYAHLVCGESAKNRAEIDLGALRHNYRLLCRAIRANGPCRPICVVKADAYGHGAPLCVPVLLDEGCDFFAVATVSEAMSVRAICQELGSHADVLILGYTDPVYARELAAHDLIQTLLSQSYADALAAAASAVGCRVRVHAALETGMGRIGFPARTEQDTRDTVNAIAQLCAVPSLRVEGVFSHLATADEPHNDAANRYTEQQAARFDAVITGLAEKGITLPTSHLYNSAATLRFPVRHGNAVRLGISLYGPEPYPNALPDLRPVMRLCTTVVHVGRLNAGESLGYGADYRADSPRVIATLPIGYADGFLRAYRNAHVTLHTKSGDCRVPVVGRVCMDQCMLDVTDTDVAVGDTVTLFGHSFADTPRLAAQAGTIAYEVLTSVSARVVRVPIGT